MTIAGTGSITGQIIRDEIRQSGGNIVFGDATTRWLADKPTGNIVIPTDYYNKTAVKRTHQSNTSGSGTVYNVVVDLGVDFGANRRIVICVCALAAASASQLLISGATLGGVGITQGPGQAWFNPGTNLTMGIFTATAGAITGTSATLSTTFNQSVTRYRIVVYSLSNIGTIHSQNQNGSAASVSLSTTVNVVANGVVISCGAKSDCPAGNLTLTGVIEDTDIEPGGNVRFATGFQNRLGVQTGRSCGISGTGGAEILGVAAISFGP